MSDTDSPGAAGNAVLAGVLIVGEKGAKAMSEPEQFDQWAVVETTKMNRRSIDQYPISQEVER